MLILDCPYYSFLHHIRRYGFWLPLRLLLRYQIRTDQFIKKVHCPIHIIHAVRDRLIPYRQSLMLKALLPEKIQLHPIIGASHNNIPSFPEYHDLLYDLLHEPVLETNSLQRA
jgi:pimeloyl-ACP methyl ester carboxylesterase